MTIEAIDLLHTKDIDAFAFATSDSDFTPVVMRVQAEGIKVFGFGEKKTPKPFMAACSQFIFTEKLMGSTVVQTKDSDPTQAPIRKNSKALRQDTWLVNVLRNAVDHTMDEYGWANMAEIGIYINNSTSFSPVNYGYKKLSNLIKETDLFDISFDDSGKQMRVKDKRLS